MRRPSWGHTPTFCDVCRKVGPRCQNNEYPYGKIHKHCMNSEQRKAYDSAMKRGLPVLNKLSTTTPSEPPPSRLTAPPDGGEEE